MPTIGDESFRREFYTRWGKENCISGARTRRAEYPDFEQRLSIKAAWGGAEDYFIDNRRIRVDDDTFLVLNDARTYSSSVRTAAPMTSFSIFFRPGMAAEVASGIHAPDDPEAVSCRAEGARSIEVSEQVRPHERAAAVGIAAIRASTRKELLRRTAHAVNFIHARCAAPTQARGDDATQ